MITFDCMKKIKDGRPPIIESVTDTDSGIVYEYSDFCFVKNQYGYTVARYVKTKYGKNEYDEGWDDSPSRHPLSEDDEYYVLSKNCSPIFSFHCCVGKNYLDYVEENNDIAKEFYEKYEPIEAFDEKSMYCFMKERKRIPPA